MALPTPSGLNTPFTSSSLPRPRLGTSGPVAPIKLQIKPDPTAGALKARAPELRANHEHHQPLPPPTRANRLPPMTPSDIEPSEAIAEEPSKTPALQTQMADHAMKILVDGKEVTISKGAVLISRSGTRRKILSINENTIKVEKESKYTGENLDNKFLTGLGKDDLLLASQDFLPHIDEDHSLVVGGILYHVDFGDLEFKIVEIHIEEGIVIGVTMSSMGTETKHQDFEHIGSVESPGYAKLRQLISSLGATKSRDATDPVSGDTPAVALNGFEDLLKKQRSLGNDLPAVVKAGE